MKFRNWFFLFIAAVSLNSCSYICHTSFENHTSEKIKITFNIVNSKFYIKKTLPCHVQHVDSNSKSHKTLDSSVQIHQLNDQVIYFEIPPKTTYSFQSINSLFQGVYMNDTLNITIGNKVSSTYRFYNQNLHFISKNNFVMKLKKRGGLMVKNKFQFIIDTIKIKNHSN